MNELTTGSPWERAWHHQLLPHDRLGIGGGTTLKFNVVPSPLGCTDGGLSSSLVVPSHILMIQLHLPAL